MSAFCVMVNRDVALPSAVLIPTRSEESIVIAIALALSSMPGDVNAPVNVGLASGAFASN